ncbi:unnamed protein product, partial [Polarella glacialis]
MPRRTPMTGKGFKEHFKAKKRHRKQNVWVKDKIYMCMGPDVGHFRVDRHRLVCTFWSLCIPAGEERAIVTKHVLINETHTHVSREVGLACSEISEATVSNILQHLQKLLTA